MSEMQTRPVADSDNDLADPIVLTKYRLAADIANQVLTAVLSEVAAGVNIGQLCMYGDHLISDKVSKVYNKKKVEKGIAFPTSISVNSCVSGYAPKHDNSAVLQDGDIVKIELGVHIDGYIASVAHTVIINPNPAEPIRGPAADVLCAAYVADQIAWKMIKPGTKASDVVSAINLAALAYGCVPVANTFTCITKRFLPSAQPLIFHSKPQTSQSDDLEFEHNHAYTVNVTLVKGDEPEVKETDVLPCILKRDVSTNYCLKMKSSREVFNEISQKFGVFPFSINALTSLRARLGLNELINHSLVTVSPVHFSSSGQAVAQFKFTILLQANLSTLRLTLPPGSEKLEMPFVYSEFKLPAELERILNLERPRVAGEKIDKKIKMKMDRDVVME